MVAENGSTERSSVDIKTGPLETTQSTPSIQSAHSGQDVSTDAGDASAAAEKNNDGDALEKEEEYPSSWRLALITIALCLSVFCMALVSLSMNCRATDDGILTKTG